jgi:divalent metal cation (Fe/Co/Zn/Cd) transporter
VSIAEPHSHADTLNRIRAIQWFTIFWMFVELIVSGISAWRAQSPALLAFGGDSGIELLSACVVLWHFRSPSTRDQTEKTSAQIAAGLLFLLAAFVLVASVGSLMGHIETRPSRLGIGLLLTASVVMPWLARQKRRLSGATASASLRADAAQSALCGYMAWIALAGLILNAIWSIGWADPVAALVLTPLILREGWETAKGKPCSCY